MFDVQLLAIENVKSEPNVNDNTGTTTPVLLRQIEKEEERTKDLLSEINLYNVTCFFVLSSKD